MGKITLTVDGRAIEADAGATVLEAALGAGIYIPHLCYHPDLVAVGACRLCMVEIEGVAGLCSACTTPAKQDMVVGTTSPAIDQVRRVSMELILATHPHDCMICPKYLNCELQSVFQYLETSDSRFRPLTRLVPADTSNPLFLRDLMKCVLCGRCVRACSDLRGVGILSILKNETGTSVVIEGGVSLADAGCRFCGACVAVCPTGAMRDHPRLMEHARSRRGALLPCTYACPAEIDVPSYVRLVQEGKYSDAAAVVREKAPFPHVLGYVCSHPCESVCRRTELNQAVSIRALKRCAAEWADEPVVGLPVQPPSGKRVAVVGSGPAGLTAAYYLARSGHAVTVFEALPLAGGMLRVGIPEYRLPRDLLDSEIARIAALGVDIRTDTAIESLDDLLIQGNDAILVAIGAHRGKKLHIPGADTCGVFDSTAFLRDVLLGKKVTVGARVVVLGGGNVAFDCARTAIRLGAADVTVACLEDRECMLAGAAEIEEALEEGVAINNSKSFARIVGQDGLVHGVECEQVERFAFEEDGRLNVECVEGSLQILPADTVIFAVGQSPEVPQGFALDTDRNGLVELDPFTGATQREGVFAAGDVVTGTDSVIAAIASGRRSASAIDSYLGGPGLVDERLTAADRQATCLGRRDDFASLTRSPIPLRRPEERVRDFGVVELSMDRDAARAEAARCLQCDLRLEISPVRFWADC